MTAILIFSVFCISSSVSKASNPYDMTSVNRLISDLITANLHRPDTAIQEKKLQDSAVFKQLQDKCKLEWADIIENISSVTGGNTAQELVLSALQELNGGDYMSAVECLVRKFEADEFDKDLMMTLVGPTGRMQAFLADNYDHSRVITALNAIKTKAINTPKLDSQIDSILDGSIKQSMEEFRDAHEE